MARSVTSQLVVELLDRVSEPARRMRESLGGITQSVRDANAQRVDFGQRIDAAITRNNRAIDQTRGRMIDAAAGAYMLARGLSAPVRVAADFEQGMNRVRVLTEATDEQFERMSAQARELGRTTMFSATEATEGMGFLAQAGFEADQIVGALPGTLQLAAAGQMDLASAADIASNVLSGYRLDVQDLTHVNDVMAATFTSTNTNLAQLGEAMSYAAPFAASAGIEFEEASAAIGLLGSAGIQGSRAGSALGQAINRMLNPTNAMREDMEELGLTFTDSEGRLLPLVDVVRQLEEHSEDAGLMARLFGQRAGPAMASLIGMGADELEELRDGMDDVGGTAERVAGVEMEGFNGRVRAMHSAMEGLQLVIGNALLPVLTSMVDVLTDMMQPLAGLIEQYPQITATVIGLTSSVIALRIAAIGARFVGLHLKGALLALAAPAWRAAAGVGALAAAITATTWGAFAAGLARARRGMIAFAAAARIGGIGAALATIGTSAVAALNPLRLLRAGLRRTAVSMRVLTAAVVGTGIGAVLVGIGLAGAWIYRNWAGIKEAFAGFREGFNAAIEPVRPALEPVIGLFETLFGWIGRLTGPLDASAEDWRAWGQSIGETVGSFVVAVMEIPERVREAANNAGAWLGSLRDRAGAALGDLWAGFEAGWDGLVAYTHEAGASLRDAGREAISALWAGMRERYSGLLEWAQGWTREIASRVQSDGLLATGAGLIDAMLRGMISAAADLVEWAALLPARIIDSLLGTDLAGPGRDLIRGLRRGIARQFDRLLEWTVRWPHEIADQIETDGLRATGISLLQSLWSGMIERWMDALEWIGTLPLRVIDAIAGTDLAPQGRAMIASLRAGISERFSALRQWAVNWPREIGERIHADGLRATGAALLGGMFSAMIERGADLLEWVGKLPRRIAGMLGVGEMLDAGLGLVQGLWDGMQQRLGRLLRWAASWPDDLAAQLAEDGLFETGISLLQSLWDGMAEMAGDLFEWAAEIPGQIGELIADTNLAQIGADIIQSLWDGMVRKFRDLIGWVRDIPRAIRDAIGNIDLSDAIRWPQRPGWLGGDGGSSVMDGMDGATPTDRAPSDVLRERSGGVDLGLPSAVDGFRRRGGPISAGGAYVVGEEEAELITPTRSGYVHPVSDLLSRLTAGGPRATRATEGGRIAEEAMRHVAGRLHSAFRGLGRTEAGRDEKGIHLAPLIADAPEASISADLRVQGDTADTSAQTAGDLHAEAAPDRTVRQDFHVTITPTIQVDGGAGHDPRSTADEVARQIERSVREAFRGVMADTGMRTI